MDESKRDVGSSVHDGVGHVNATKPREVDGNGRDPPVDEMKRDVGSSVHDGVGHVNYMNRRKVDGSGTSSVGDWRLEDELSKMILEGILEDLQGDRGDSRLLSPVVTRSASSVNRHIRDEHIIFQEAAHRYILHPGTDMEAVFPISVSGLWARYFEEFDAEAVTKQWFDDWAVKQWSPYFAVIREYRERGESDEQIARRIRDAWREKGLIASAAGTRMHRNIELALGGELYDGRSREMTMFRSFVSEWLEPREWRVYRLEWAIYCSQAMVAGQIDAIFVRDGEYYMVDWKRCSKPLDDQRSFRDQRGRCPLESLRDNTCNHYFVQQNLYAAILERRYSIYVSRMWLCQIHPDYESYRLIAVPELREQAGKILDQTAVGRTVMMPWETQLPVHDMG